MQKTDLYPKGRTQMANDSKALIIIFSRQRDEVTGGWLKLHNN
jgi:hypothetical protein